MLVNIRDDALSTGDPDTIVLLEYGGEAHITMPKNNCGS